MTVNVKDFVVEARLQDLRIEAESKEAALEKLYKMSLEDILEEGAYVDDVEIKDIEAEIEEIGFKAKVKNVKYDLDESDLLGTDFASVEELADSLPTELEVTVDGFHSENGEIDDDEYVRSDIEDEIFGITKVVPSGFDYEIIERF